MSPHVLPWLHSEQLCDDNACAPALQTPQHLLHARHEMAITGWPTQVELAADTPKGKVKSAAGAAAAAVSTVLAEAPVASSVGKVDPEEGTVIRVATRYGTVACAGCCSL